MNVRRKVIQRIRITGRLKEHAKALDYCTVRGFTIVWSGGRRGQPGKMLVIAEREMMVEKDT